MLQCFLPQITKLPLTAGASSLQPQEVDNGGGDDDDGGNVRNDGDVGFGSDRNGDEYLTGINPVVNSNNRNNNINFNSNSNSNNGNMSAVMAVARHNRTHEQV